MQGRNSGLFGFKLLWGNFINFKCTWSYMKWPTLTYLGSLFYYVIRICRQSCIDIQNKLHNENYKLYRIDGSRNLSKLFRSILIHFTILLRTLGYFAILSSTLGYFTRLWSTKVTYFPLTRTVVTNSPWWRCDFFRRPMPRFLIALLKLVVHYYVIFFQTVYNEYKIEKYFI